MASSGNVAESSITGGELRIWRTVNMVPLRGAQMGSFGHFSRQVLPFHDGDEEIARWFGTNTNIDQSGPNELRETRSVSNPL